MSKKLILTPNAYKAGKVYAVKPINGTGDFDFVRNTGRTRVNVNGNIEELSNNIVALDYQNGCPELLLEPQRTNLIKYSNDLQEWNPFVATENSLNITSDFTNSPIKNELSDRLLIDGFIAFRSPSFPTTSGKYYTASFYAKALTGTCNISEVKLSVGSGQEANILTTNLIINEGWQYYSFTVERTFTESSTVLFLNIETGDVSLTGFQVEESEKPTSYIPTNGSTVTRNQDILQKDLTPIIEPTYTAFLEVVGDEGRLKIEDNDTGIDLPLNGSGKIAIQVDSQIKIIFPDNGQPQTELVYDKPDDLRNIDILSKLAATRIGVIAIEDGIQDVSNWVSGNVSSYWIETDWSAETNLVDEFREEDWDYFPAIDLSNATNFGRAWRENKLTSFPAIDLSKGINFFAAWFGNNLTSFPANMFDTNTASDYGNAFRNNALDQTSVDNILISINTSAQNNNITNGGLGIQGANNATPSQAGKDAADALFANGWTVLLNGYTPS